MMKNNFWKNGLTIDESRISTLMILLIFFSLVGIYKLFTQPDIPPNLVNVILGFATAVAGVNIADRYFNRGQNDSDDNQPTI